MYFDVTVYSLNAPESRFYPILYQLVKWLNIKYYMIPANVSCYQMMISGTYAKEIFFLRHRRTASQIYVMEEIMLLFLWETHLFFLASIMKMVLSQTHQWSRKLVHFYHHRLSSPLSLILP